MRRQIMNPLQERMRDLWIESELEYIRMGYIEFGHLETIPGTHPDGKTIANQIELTFSGDRQIQWTNHARVTQWVSSMTLKVIVRVSRPGEPLVDISVELWEQHDDSKATIYRATRVPMVKGLRELEYALHDKGDDQ